MVDDFGQFSLPIHVLKHLRRPRLSYAIAALREKEAEELWHVDMLLSQLDGYVSQFQDALDLFDYAEAKVPTSFTGAEDKREWRWAFIAARDAGMTIYHFGMTRAAIHDRIRFCPAIRPHFDNTSMRLAKRLFDANFSRAERIRHAIGHQAEMIESPDALKRTREGKRNSPRSNPGMLMIGNLAGRRYETTHDGERMSFEISKDTLQKLERINDLVFDAFRPIAAAFQPLRVASRHQAD